MFVVIPKNLVSFITHFVCVVFHSSYFFLSFEAIVATILIWILNNSINVTFTNTNLIISTSSHSSILKINECWCWHSVSVVSNPKWMYFYPTPTLFTLKSCIYFHVQYFSINFHMIWSNVFICTIKNDCHCPRNIKKNHIQNESLCIV